MLRLTLQTVMLLAGLITPVQFLAAADSPASFSHLVTSKTAETFAAVQQFLKTASADDREAASAWLFRTASDFGWESQVLAEAESYVKDSNANPLTVLNAEQVRLSGLAQSEKSEEAVQEFQMFVRKLRLRSPNLAIDMAEALAMQLQLAGDRPAALAVYEKLTGAFFLNAEVKDISERRTNRLKLVGQPSPLVTDVDLAAWTGKVVLLDFWATNCRPCLEDLPKLREIYAEFHPLGLEIAGVSFDEDETVLAEFLERQRLPWTIIKNDKQTPDRFHVDLIPCLILIDPQGKVVCTDAKVAHLRGALRKLLSKTP